MATNFSRFVANWYRGCEVIASRLDLIDSLRIEPCKAESFHRKSIFLVYKYGGCEVTAIRVDSIDSLRIEPCKAESFHRKSIFLVYKYGGYEVTVIRVDSIDSLRIEPCKAESFHQKSIFPVHKCGGVNLLRFESIRSIRFGGSRFVCMYWGSNFVRFMSIRGLLCINISNPAFILKQTSLQ